MNYIDFLQNAIEKTHGCRSTHVETVPVRETFQGETVWDGSVEVFDLAGHPKAKQCYAWGYAEDNKRDLRAVTVLALPPIDSPLKAVQAFIVSESKKG